MLNLQVFSRAKEGLSLHCGDNTHVRLPETRHQNLLSFGGGVDQLRMSAQGTQCDYFHVRHLVRQVVLQQRLLPPNAIRAFSYYCWRTEDLVTYEAAT